MRVLVVDESRVLSWVVSRLAGPEVDIDPVDSFEEALERVSSGAPIDAAVVSLTPARLPWRAFQRACAERRPQVPVLYESCVHAGGADLGLTPFDGSARFLAKPASRAELEAALYELLDRARTPISA